MVAYIVMARTVVAHIVMAHIVMAHIVMACQVGDARSAAAVRSTAAVLR